MFGTIILRTIDSVVVFFEPSRPRINFCFARLNLHSTSIQSVLTLQEIFSSIFLFVSFVDLPCWLPESWIPRLLQKDKFSFLLYLFHCSILKLSFAFESFLSLLSIMIAKSSVRRNKAFTVIKLFHGSVNKQPLHRSLYRQIKCIHQQRENITLAQNIESYRAVDNIGCGCHFKDR